MSEIKYGYMCYTDFAHEVGESPNGIDVYRSVDDLCKNRDCVLQCGIVKVKVVLDTVLVESNWKPNKITRTLEDVQKEAENYEDDNE
jgi:hypothetical protein